MIALTLALALLEWAAAGLALLAGVVAIQVGILEPALVGAVAAAVAALARVVALRRVTGLYRDADLCPRLARRPGPSVNDNGGCP